MSLGLFQGCPFSLPPPFSSLPFLPFFAPTFIFLFLYSSPLSFCLPESSSFPVQSVLSLGHAVPKKEGHTLPALLYRCKCSCRASPLAPPLASPSPYPPPSSLVRFSFVSCAPALLPILAVSSLEASSTPSFLYGSPHSLEGALKNTCLLTG